MSDDFGDFEHYKHGVDLMGDILSAFDDIEEGKPVPKKLPDGSTFVNDFAQVNLAETKNLLHGLQELTGEYGNIQEESFYGQEYINVDSDNDYDSIYGYYEPQEGENFIEDPIAVRMRQVKPQTQQQQSQPSTPVQQNRPYVPGMNWGIIEESVLGMKNAKTYSIKCLATNQVVLDNIMMYESALALRNLLNAGRTLTDTKVLGIISSGIQYTNVVKEAIKAAKERQNVLKESKYDKAQELDTVIAEHKKKAQDLKARVLNFLKEEGFITK